MKTITLILFIVLIFKLSNDASLSGNLYIIHTKKGDILSNYHNSRAMSSFFYDNGYKGIIIGWEISLFKYSDNELTYTLTVDKIIDYLYITGHINKDELNSIVELINTENKDYLIIALEMLNTIIKKIC